jgi:hypothetical protein
MDVVSPGPLPVSSIVWQPRAGHWTLTVVCKATFELRPVESPLASQQDPINEDDNHWNDDPSRSLYSPSDLVPLKQRADILLVGSAFAPAKQPVRSLFARLVVGEVDKSIEVWCDRVFTQDGQLHEGQRFLKMTLRYERAAGGGDSENPVGLRADGPPDVYGAVAIPNLVPPGLMVAQRGDHPPPIGYGPIAASWPRRRERLGRHAGSWPRSPWNEQPVPEDIDRSFFNVAPRDQQTDLIRPDERIVLENLHAEHARLVTALPGIRPRAAVERTGAPSAELPMTADTLWIDTDRGVCTLTWRGQVRLTDRNEAGRVMIVTERKGAPLAPTVDESDVAQTIVPFLTSKPSMPFVPAHPGESPMARSRAAAQTMRLDAPVPGEPEEISVDDDMISAIDANAAGSATLFLMHGAKGAGAAPLPFSAPAASPAPPPVPAAPVPPPMNVAPPPPPIWDPPPRPVPPPAPSSPWAGASPLPGTASERPLAAPALDSAGFARIGVQGASVLDASNSAAARDAMKPRPSEPATPSPAAPEARPKASSREVLKLLWFDPKSLPRIRKHREWRVILAELELKLLDEGDDEEAEAGEKDRRDVFEVLAKGHATGAEGIKVALEEAVSDDGKFEPPLVLLSGELEFPFDGLETLKATAAAMAPFATSDKKLKEQLDAVEELLKTPWLQGSGQVAEGMSEKLEEVFAQGKRSVAPDYVQKHTERMLLEQRCYQRRTVFGKKWIRSVLRGGGMPVYVPEALKDELPMFKRVRVKLLGEVDMQEDQYESAACAVKVVGLGRVMSG